MIQLTKLKIYLITLIHNSLSIPGPRGHRRTTMDDYRARGNEDPGYFGGRSGYLSPFERSYHPQMQRSHSRASLFTGRMTDLDYGGPSPMYRSVSRGSLTGDYPVSSLVCHLCESCAYSLIRSIPIVRCLSDYKLKLICR